MSKDFVRAVEDAIISIRHVVGPNALGHDTTDLAITIVTKQQRLYFGYEVDAGQYHYRAQLAGGMISLTRWDSDMTIQTSSYLEAAAPKWLRTILDIARVGGHMTRPLSKPPDEIVWFATDTKHNLKEFIEC
jgi:hypothetical protein